MSVLKDRANFNNIIQGLRHTRTSDDNIFVSFSSPRAAGAEQTTRAQTPRTPPIIRLLSEISNEEDLMDSSNALEEEFGGLPSVLLTPTSPNDAKSSKFNILDSSSSARPKKKLRVDNHGSKKLSLQNKLQGLTKSQLINLLDTLVCDRHPELEEEIQQLVPEPDLQAMEARLKTLKRSIYKAFPHRGSHVGSTRDSFNYRRVHSHVIAFKKECIDQGNNLVTSGLWTAVMEYVLMAWSNVDDLPTWDNPAHNTSKSSCFKTLAVQFQQALSNGSFTIQEYKMFQTRLEEACSINKHLQPCLRQVNEILN
ncbi:tethering factor for nuclear proteasome sts1-like [Actinia tenebrosa]|uniref:Tethering factor for nuclear proteasome sts1-like n=1 Tax=Actinia tenebrosa TaxID=6105 RepID=A0A6P8IQM2_ACTTE|nr:tethering factor for nuclear proteasome sts1-like [Actinia tenebrosa]